MYKRPEIKELGSVEEFTAAQRPRGPRDRRRRRSVAPSS